jgi:integrase
LPAPIPSPILSFLQGERPVSEERLPLPLETVRAIEDDLCRRKDQTLFHLFTLLKLTGARLSEITGLLIEEVHLDADIPFVDIKPRSGRSLKNAWSKRIIPLTPKAHAAAVLAAQAAGSSPHLFEKFALGRGSDNASARLLKAIRKQTSNRKHTAHSLRHNFRDRIRQVKTIPLELGNALEGRKCSIGEEPLWRWLQPRNSL